MPTAKEHAIDLYMRAIRDGDARGGLDANVGDRYVQHSTGVKDGKEGFLEFFVPFLERNPRREMKVVRALQDGSKVFLHVFQNLNDGQAKWVTADFFDSDAEGKIIEHWDVITAYSDANPSGRSNIDGPTEIVDHDKTEDNKALVRRFVEQCLIRRDLDGILGYIDGKRYAQHNPDVGDGLDSFLERFRPETTPLKYHELFMLVGEGNFVATMSRTSFEGVPQCQVDVFRVDHGKIVEHWDAAEPVPPRETWANSGKF